MSLDATRGGVRKRIVPQHVSPSGIDSLISATEGLALSKTPQVIEDDSAPAVARRPRSVRATSTPYTIVRQHSRSAAGRGHQSQPQSQQSSGSSVACSPTTPSSDAQRRLHALRRRLVTPSSPRTPSTTARTRSASLLTRRKSERVGRFQVTTYERKSSPETAYQGEAMSVQLPENPFGRHSAPQAGDGETLRGGMATGIGRGLGVSRATSEPPWELDRYRVRNATPDMELSFGEADIEDMEVVPTAESRTMWCQAPAQRPRPRDGGRRLEGAGVGLEPGYLGDKDGGRRHRKRLSTEAIGRVELQPSSAVEYMAPPTNTLSRMPQREARLEGVRGVVGTGYSPSDAVDPLKKIQQARDRRK